MISCVTICASVNIQQCTRKDFFFYGKKKRLLRSRFTFGLSCFLGLYHGLKAGMKIILSPCLLNVIIVPGLESQADHRSKQNWLYLSHSSSVNSGVCKQNPG